MEFHRVQISLVLTLRELCGLRDAAVNQFEPVRKTLELCAAPIPFSIFKTHRSPT